MSSVPQNKEELLKAVNDNYAKLEKDLLAIPAVPPELTTERTLEGHAKNTQMSLRELVAYLIGWNELVLKWHHKRRNGETVDFPETGYKWNELGRLAQKFYADYANFGYPELLVEFASAKARMVALVESYTDDELYGAAWYDKWTMGRMIQFNTSSPYKNARGRVSKWRKSRAS